MKRILEHMAESSSGDNAPESPVMIVEMPTGWARRRAIGAETETKN
jgi:hypothetical protein